MDEFTVADVLGCVGADLTDVARRVGELPPEVQAAAAGTELATITTPRDGLTRAVARVHARIASSVTARAAGRVPSQSQREEVAKVHLPYEIRTLRQQVRLLAQLVGGHDAQVDALVEASLVHVRVLDEFLCSPPGRDDDVRAIHYAREWRPGDHAVLSVEQRRDVNAQLFHLVGRRVQSRRWNLDALTRRACLVFCSFVTQVDDEWREHFDVAHAEARRGAFS